MRTPLRFERKALVTMIRNGAPALTQHPREVLNEARVGSDPKGFKTRDGRRLRSDLIVASVATAAVFVGYMIGSGRGLGYDSAVAFAYSIATHDFFDAFGGAVHGPYAVGYSIRTTDHVLVSLVGHAIYTITGTHSEWVYRAFPALSGAITVGVSGAWLSRRFGLVPGWTAAAFIATDPILVENVRDVRGYGPMTLFCVVASLLLMTETWTFRRSLIYALCLVLAAASQPFGLLIVPVHIAAIAVRQPHRLRTLAPAWLIGVLGGLLANAGPIWATKQAGGIGSGLVDPSFLPLLPLYLLGGSVLLALGLWFATFLLGLYVERQNAVLWVTVAVIAVVTAVLVYALHPDWLYPRFYVFLVPAAAFVLAAAIKRWVVLAPVVALGALAACAAQAPAYLMPQFPIRQAASMATAARQDGMTACLLPPDNSTIPAYTLDYRLVTNSAQFAACDVVLLPNGDADPKLKAVAVKLFPEHRQLPAIISGWVLWRAGAKPPPVEAP